MQMGVTCTCKLQGKSKYPNTISQGDLPLDFDFVGRAENEKVDWRIYPLVPAKEGADVYGARKGISYGPLHPDLPPNVFKC